MLLKDLCECSGAPGGEDKIRQIIATELVQIGCPYEIDHLGNVIAHHPGSNGNKKLLFTAHMDEPALMISEITEAGFLRFKAVGTNIVPRQLAGRTVRIGRDVTGVVGFAPYHMMKIDQEYKEASAKHQHIDVGSSSRARTLERVTIGDYAVVDSPFLELGDNLKGKAMNSRTGCWELLKLVRHAPEAAFDAAFTVMHEVGQRGMAVAAYTQQPDLVISVSTIPATDVPGSLDGEGRVALGQGVCIACIDAGFAYRHSTVERARQLAKEADIPHRLVPYAPAAAAAGFAALCRTGSEALSLLIPCRNPMSPAGIVGKSDLSAMDRMLEQIVNNN